MQKRWSIDDLQEIWKLASLAHDGQKYGGQDEGQQIEYINHIGAVTFEVIKATEIDSTLDADLAIKCALLHDTIEDTQLTIEEITTRFGHQVAMGVDALTKREKDATISDKMLDSLERIKQQPKEVWAVKMADRICNLYAPPYYWGNNKKQAYINEAKLIHHHLSAGCAYLADRLLEKIEKYKSYIK